MLRGLKDFTQVLLRHRRLDVKLGEETPNAARARAGVPDARRPQGDADHVRSVGMQTEQAYLDLVEKEDRAGFARLYQAPKRLSS